MAIKETDPEKLEKENEGKSKALLTAAAILAAIDSAKNAPFAGHIGAEKRRATKGTAESILNNQIEGTDVMENFGMEPGGVPAYVAGNAWDLLSPPSLALTALKVPSLLSKAAKMTGVSDKLIYSGVKDSLEKGVSKELMDDVPVLAKEMIDSKIYKNINNPKKALEQMRGKKVLKNLGTEANPVMSMERATEKEPLMDMLKRFASGTGEKFTPQVSKGTLDHAGEKVDEVLTLAQAKGAKPVNVKNIKDKIVAEAEAKNLDKTVAGRKKIDKLDKQLDDTLKPTRKRTQDDPPPFIPEKESDEAIEDYLAKVQDIKNDGENVPDVVDVKTLWEKRKSIDDNLYNNKKLPKTAKLSEKDEMLQKARREVESSIEESLGPIRLEDGWADEAYKSAKAKYGNQVTLEKIMDEARYLELQKKGVVDELMRGGADVAASGGRRTPYVTGRIGGNMANRIYNKGKIVAGETLENPYKAKTVSEIIGEMAENMMEGETDPPYHLGNKEPEAPAEEEAQFEMPEGYSMEPPKEVPAEPVKEEEPEFELPEGYSMTPPKRGPSSVVEVPQAEEAAEIMAPEASSEIETKMDETLAPPKPQWDPYINEDVLNTPLPRNTDRLLKNPTALMAKLQQVAPSQVPALKDMMEHDQEGLKEMAPQLAMMFPAVFERDKYGMFDGKIADPMMQQKFLADLSRDEAMDSIEKANIAMKLHRQESIF